jgi:hypothetical protein
MIKNDRAGTYVSYLTSGKVYIAERIDLDKIDPTTIYKNNTSDWEKYGRQEWEKYELYKMYSDSDTIIYTTIVKSSHLNGDAWDVIDIMDV